MPTLTYIHRRKLISSLAVALVLLGSSFGLAKSAAAAPPERPGPVAALVHAESPSIRKHFAELEVDSGEARNPLETFNLATARPQAAVSVGGRRR
jgi:hypothetical protein